MPAPDALFLLHSARRQDPRVAEWFALTDPMRAVIEPWWERLRALGEDVDETLHDHCPTACLESAAFAYVAAYRGHAAVGFFHGAWLPDPAGLLEGAGVRMRHVKLTPGREIDEPALQALLAAAYRDIAARLRELRT